MARINKNDIVEKVADEVYLSKRDAKDAIDATFRIIVEALVNGDEVNISNFATFKVKEKKPRYGVHPSTGEKMNLNPRRSVSIKLSDSVKDQLK